MKKGLSVVTDAEHHHRDRWLVSYADLVTLLLALFIVMYAASDQERAKQIVESFNNGSGVLPGSTAESSEDETAMRFLANPVLLQTAKIRQTDRGLVISLAEAGFFASGDASLSTSSADAIVAIADVLKDSTLPVRIEGHTDSTPISNSRFPSNWELSTARAASVLVRLSELGIGPERLSAAGYAGFQPVEDNSTVEGRARNRRVDVVVLNR
jgi:chemotaxis protein MotB